MKPYSAPEHLKLMRCLMPRIKPVADDMRRFENHEKGHEGELAFASLVQKAPAPVISLHDLLLTINNTTFQLDALLLIGRKIHLCEVKNYEGDFYIENDNWYTKSGTEIKNPIHQLKRSESLLRQFLHKHRLSDYAITGNIIFINPNFTLYQAPLNLPIIFPGQVDRFLSSMRQSPAMLQSERKLAELILSNLSPEIFDYQLPDYTFETLSKGITCGQCTALSTMLKSRTIHCKSCHTFESTTSAVGRSITEFRLLFPKEKLTTGKIFEWCGGMIRKRIVARVLGQHFKAIGTGKSAYYIDKKQAETRTSPPTIN